MKRFWTIILLFLVLTGCNAETAQAPQEDTPPSPPIVSEKNNLMFSWFTEEGAQTATSLEDIPLEARSEVRVQDLDTPPEKRNTAWIFIADLTAADKNGRIPVKAVKRANYELKRHPVSKASPPAPSDGAPGGTEQVVMYATPHCPHCKTARKWLLEQQIPYREINLEKDQSAAAALHQKGQAQGVSTSGVPMFEVNGRLIPGFSPEAIRKALKTPPPA